ncbi:nucleolin-like [Anneissia japonica]|uniref:nucleolin-like n=1 Tax=Anneissia japonica TaxID=1529436 RepID=UPI001425636B|nr:nucleolin-like [Anneissia japonica]
MNLREYAYNISDDVDDDIENSSYEIDEHNVEVEVNMKDGEEGKIVEGLEDQHDEVEEEEPGSSQVVEDKSQESKAGKNEAPRESMKTVSYTHLDVYKRQVRNECEEIDDSLWDVTPPDDKDNISDDVDDDIENSSYEIDEHNVEVEVNMKDGEEGKIVEGLEDQHDEVEEEEPGSSQVVEDKSQESKAGKNEAPRGSMKKRSVDKPNKAVKKAWAKKSKPAEKTGPSNEMSDVDKKLLEIMKGTGNEDEADNFGKIVATKMRKISEDDRGEMELNILMLFNNYHKKK